MNDRQKLVESVCEYNGKKFDRNLAKRMIAVLKKAGYEVNRIIKKSSGTLSFVELIGYVENPAFDGYIIIGLDESTGEFRIEENWFLKDAASDLSS